MTKVCGVGFWLCDLYGMVKFSERGEKVDRIGCRYDNKDIAGYLIFYSAMYVIVFPLVVFGSAYFLTL